MDNKTEATLEIDQLTLAQQQQFDDRTGAFVGQWHQLISTTNWEKGAIITAWQADLEKAGLPRSSYSDERWSQLAGGATPQHVGRLRRTFARFGKVYPEYTGLYWSHFHAALDWDDAEMWLEGALQNSWSVSRMRNVRWETMGSRPEDQPKIEEIVIAEDDEEVRSEREPERSTADRNFTEGPLPEGPDFGDSESTRSVGAENGRDRMDAEVTENSVEKIRPFESFRDLPDDIRHAANAFKIAIIKHKSEGWEEISLDELSCLLDALKALASSPA